MKEWLLRRFAEKSTWMGGLAVAVAFGVPLTEVQQAALATFGALLCMTPDTQHK